MGRKAKGINMILSQNISIETTSKSNNNSLILGVPGSGKTRYCVMPNLCEEEDRSVIVLDPKGELFDMTHKMMARKGYLVKQLDFCNPDKSYVKYNPLAYIHDYNDILYIANAIVYSGKPLKTTADPFWDKASVLLLSALLAYLKDYGPPHQRTLKSVAKLLAVEDAHEDVGYKSKLERIFDEVYKRDPSSFALRQYTLFRKAADRTLKSILITLSSELCTYLTPEMEQLLDKDTLNIPSVGRMKTAIYVKVSDIDRSKDALVNILFNQFFNVLYREADSNIATHSLDVPVQFYLDDLGTNLKLDRLDCILAGCRSRGIGCTIILQSIGQLRNHYGDAFDAITNSCSAFVYLGGIDYGTNEYFSKLANLPLSSLLEKNEENCWVFVQGRKPVCDRKFALEKHRNYHMLADTAVSAPEQEAERIA